MTLDEIRQSAKDVLTPSDVAEVLETDPHSLRLCARKYPERIGFPFTFTGDSGKFMKIPRIGFIKWFEGR